MEDPVVVCVLHRFGNGCHVVGGRARPQGMVANQVSQALSFHELHGNEVLPFELANVVNAHDVRVA